MIFIYFLGLEVHDVQLQSSCDMNVVKLFGLDDVVAKIVPLWMHVPKACGNKEDISDFIRMKRKKILILDLLKVFFILFLLPK